MDLISTHFWPKFPFYTLRKHQKTMTLISRLFSDKLTNQIWIKSPSKYLKSRLIVMYTPKQFQLECWIDQMSFTIKALPAWTRPQYQECIKIAKLIVLFLFKKLNVCHKENNHLTSLFLFLVAIQRPPPPFLSWSTFWMPPYSIFLIEAYGKHYGKIYAFWWDSFLSWWNSLTFLVPE